MVLLLGQHPSKPRSFAVVPAEEVCYNRLKCKTLWNEGKKMQDRLMTKTSDYYYDLPQELKEQAEAQGAEILFADTLGQMLEKVLCQTSIKAR